MSFSLLGLSPCAVPKNLFLEKIAPCRVPHACKFCEGAAQIKSLKMASEITFVNEDNIEFLSSVSLSSLKQAFAQNFIHSDSESGESSSSDGSSNDFSDKSSSEDASEMSSYEESLKDVRANCFCASLLRTQMHTPRHTRSRALSNKMRNDRAKGHCYSFAWI